MAITTRNGFTLLDTILAMVVVAILASLALPVYTDQRLKSRRSEAYAALNHIMQAQERFATEYGYYTTDLTALGYNDPYPTVSGYYRISANDCANNPLQYCVALTANAVGHQQQDNNGWGGNLRITSLGQKQGW